MDEKILEMLERISVTLDNIDSTLNDVFQVQNYIEKSTKDVKENTAHNYKYLRAIADDVDRIRRNL